MSDKKVEVFVVPDERLSLKGEREDGSGFIDWGDAYLHVHAGDVLLRATNRHGDVGHAFICHGRHRTALLETLLQEQGYEKRLMAGNHVVPKGLEHKCVECPTIYVPLQREEPEE